MASYPDRNSYRRHSKKKCHPGAGHLSRIANTHRAVANVLYPQGVVQVVEVMHVVSFHRIGNTRSLGESSKSLP